MKTVFVSGRFNVLHPGHVRLLQFARGCGDRLVVGVDSDATAGDFALVPEALRLEAVRSCSFVDEAFLIQRPLADTLLELRPAVVVKGREHEHQDNPEQLVLDSYGGKLLFSSGEVAFTSRDLIRREFTSSPTRLWGMPKEFMARHGISVERLREILGQFSRLRVLVVGDLIIDEYISCDPLGMSQEDPTLVVKPIDSKRFIGGAGIVAAHASSLGAEATLLTVVGADDEAEFGKRTLEHSGVRPLFLRDETRPTTLKSRYRCQGKTLLRVSRLHQAPISSDLCAEASRQVSPLSAKTDVLVFSDFNYGALPQGLVEELTAMFKTRDVVLAADSQSSSQTGDIGRFKSMDLLTPTEREARLSTRNIEDGINVLAEQLRKAAAARNVFLKLGEEGALICPEMREQQPWPPDRIEALNPSPKDVAGAGDSMLIAGSMALAVGANAWEAACLGSIAAAIQVGRLGNTPISMSEMLAAVV